MTIFLSEKASKRRIREAVNARNNRWEILKALSQKQVSRRELMKWGLFSGFGAIAYKHGLSPFAGSAYAQVPTGLPASPLFGATAFSQPMPRFDVLQRKTPVDGVNFVMDPVTTTLGVISGTNNLIQPHELSNTGLRYPVDPLLVNGTAGLNGPIEGRPPGTIWAHQRWGDFLPKVVVEAAQRGATDNTTYNPNVLNSSFNSGINPAATIAPKFHPSMPTQAPTSVWTFNGTIPPKLVMGRYGEPLIFRHHNDLPRDPTANGGFGIHTISTHEHNGHHGAENDGFTGAYFYPGQFYDYHWPIVLAGHRTMNTGATDPKAGGPTDAGGINRIPGDWHETMSTHWFHDHMFSFTSQNVYKGNAAMFNLYSSLDRGAEDVIDGTNLRLPSGRASVTGKSWGNLEYDVNLMLADKAWDANGQLAMDIFDFDGFLGDQMTVNLAYKPYFEVERRKYRFRILNASVSRFFKIALANASGQAQPMIQIANDGNLLPNPVQLTSLDQMGIAERYDIVIDFSRFPLNSKVSLVNLCEHANGAGPLRDLSLADALAGTSTDPCVGKFLEFRVVRNPAQPDISQVPNVLIPNPNLSAIPIARTRVFEFGASASQPSPAGPSVGTGKWGIGVDGVQQLAADFGRVSAAPRFNTREVWTLINRGGGWDHPIHIHFEEGQVLSRNGSLANVPAAERGRKDVYRLRANGTISITMQFRDWGGMFMEHCHNTVHEDNAMLLRWEIDDSGGAFLAPLPTPIPSPTGVTFVAPTVVPGA
jgi:FtsP/CotA-like multicopper oxidase with cupredoxin domain